MEQPRGGPDRLNTALEHVTKIYALYITQRQNLVNYYAVGMGVLFVAYAHAFDKSRLASAVVCVLGVIASGAAYLNDKRLTELMAAAEDPLEKLQEHLANELKEQEREVDSLKIQKRVKHVPLWRRGIVVRATYGAFAITFILGILYAALHAARS
jgi:hypothetical protein